MHSARFVRVALANHGSRSRLTLSAAKRSRRQAQQSLVTLRALDVLQSEGQQPLYSLRETRTRCFSTTSSANNSSTSCTTSTSHSHSNQRRAKSSVAVLDEDPSSSLDEPSHTTSVSKKTTRQIHRLERIRNVGILAHVDAGKTTVTERMLALAGVVRHVGRVDTGNTVTDYLPQERERGITIQSAAIQFDWGWHNTGTAHGDTSNERVHIHLIDTPGHVDFSVEVHRSVAVLDGAVLVVDAVAGVQAQTETVWRAMQDHSPSGQALPCIVAINKMDKEGCSFANAVQTIRHKLPHANPLPIQLPLFQVRDAISDNYNCLQMPNVVALPNDVDTEQFQQQSTNHSNIHGEFIGVIDLIHMRAVIYPETNPNSSRSVEECIPDVYPLLVGGGNTMDVLDPECALTRAALQARHALVEQLAGDCQDEGMEQCYLEDIVPSPQQVQQAVRQATLTHKALPVVAAAALRGKGLEPLLDCIADLLPSPLDRPPPALIDTTKSTTEVAVANNNERDMTPATLGHPMNNNLLAFAFKVCHLSGGKGGSGDGRVVFCRVYSGTLHERDVLHVVSPPTLGETNAASSEQPRKERVGGLLELAGGAFTKKEHGQCQAGDVCALVGLKTVVTGDTLVLASSIKNNNSKRKQQSKNHHNDRVCLAGVASPKPVLQVRLEAETHGEQTRLSESLRLLAIEDPSLLVEETEAGTLLSGLGELHVEVTLDRLQREFGLVVHKGAPRVAYRETLLDAAGTNGLLRFDRTMGDTRLQASVDLRLEPTTSGCDDHIDADNVRLPLEPTVQVGPQVLQFLQLKPDASHDECMVKSPVYRALVQGCLGSLKRGPVGSYAMANVTCHVDAIDAEDGLAGLQALPGAIRAAAMNAVTSTLKENMDQGKVLEPSMSVEVSAPNAMVGTVLSDLTSRRGTVEDVITGDDSATVHQKSLVRGQVPLVEILGYANALRSLTAGEGTFSAEYKGHSVCSEIP